MNVVQGFLYAWKGKLKKNKKPLAVQLKKIVKQYETHNTNSYFVAHFSLSRKSLQQF